MSATVWKRPIDTKGCKPLTLSTDCGKNPQIMMFWGNLGK